MMRAPDDLIMVDSSKVADSNNEFSTSRTTNLAILVNGTTSGNGGRQSTPRNLASPISLDSNNSRAVTESIASRIRLGSPIESSSSSEESDDPLSDKVLDQRILPRSLTSLRTGLCYDSRMRFHTELEPGKDTSDYHPEDPRRIFHIYKTLCQAGLVEDEMTIPPLVANPVFRILARPAKKSEICLVHDEAHFNWMKGTAGKIVC